jgi:hypothetical protein
MAIIYARGNPMYCPANPLVPLTTQFPHPRRTQFSAYRMPAKPKLVRLINQASSALMLCIHRLAWCRPPGRVGKPPELPGAQSWISAEPSVSNTG